VDRITDRLVAALGRDAFDAMLLAGHDLSPEQARAQVRPAATGPAGRTR
jgi:hypothetical protein